MAEELKDKEQTKKEPEAAAKPQESAAASEAKPVEAAKTAEAKPAEVKKKKERPTNCAVCNKAFKHKHWYYKNGKYFCTKRCWEKLNAELKEKAAEAKAKEAESKEPAKETENPPA